MLLLLSQLLPYAASLHVGELIVSDTDDDSVKVISASGQPTHKIPHTFKAPTGVAVDSHDNLVVADWNDKIRVRDKKLQQQQRQVVNGISSKCI